MGNFNDDISSEEHFEIQKPVKVLTVFRPISFYFYANIWILSGDPVPVKSVKTKKKKILWREEVWYGLNLLPAAFWTMCPTSVDPVKATSNINIGKLAIYRTEMAAPTVEWGRNPAQCTVFVTFYQHLLVNYACKGAITQHKVLWQPTLIHVHVLTA
jgi:hypothetical protein